MSAEPRWQPLARAPLNRLHGWPGLSPALRNSRIATLRAEMDQVIRMIEEGSIGGGAGDIQSNPLTKEITVVHDISGGFWDISFEGQSGAIPLASQYEIQYRLPFDNEEWNEQLPLLSHGIDESAETLLFRKAPHRFVVHFRDPILWRGVVYDSASELRAVNAAIDAGVSTLKGRIIAYADVMHASAEFDLPMPNGPWPAPADLFDAVAISSGPLTVELPDSGAARVWSTFEPGTGRGHTGNHGVCKEIRDCTLPLQIDVVVGGMSSDADAPLLDIAHHATLSGAIVAIRFKRSGTTDPSVWFDANRFHSYMMPTVHLPGDGIASPNAGSSKTIGRRTVNVPLEFVEEMLDWVQIAALFPDTISIRDVYISGRPTLE